jgi:DNA-binding response OmpR family regulator
MKKIVLIYPNKFFLEFIQAYLYKFNYLIEIAGDGISGYNKAVKFSPDLLIVNKVLPSIELDGFFVKKKIVPSLKNTPLFLIGDFSPKEILHYKDNNVEGFISTPINPQILLERLNVFFKVRSTYSEKLQTPMLFDLHAKNNIVIIQIEGNFDVANLEILNYKIRVYFNKKKIYFPKIFLIFPSLYPETITKEYIDVLFGFLKFPEFKFLDRNIKILTNNNIMINLLKTTETYSKFDRVSSYFDGMQLLNTDFDKHKEIPVEYLKPGCSYIFDLLDDEGDVRIPALSVVTADMIYYLLKTNVTKLRYYSDNSIDEITNNQNDTKIRNVTDTESKQFDFILGDAEAIESEHMSITLLNDKIKLFLNKLKGLQILVITKNEKEKTLIKTALADYVKVDYFDPDDDLLKLLENEKYILIFIDHALENQKALQLLTDIRSIATRRRTTVIIIAKALNKIELNKYKSAGTDFALLSPFSNIKLLNQVYESIIIDRRN